MEHTNNHFDASGNKKDALLDGGVVYSEYLKLDQLLSCQKLLSEKQISVAHHEHLFIIVHQVYELWFKQIIFELDSIREVFSKKLYENLDTLEIIKRLNRIVAIFKILIDQIQVLETMTPNDFAEFRDLLCPASGFQSLQFRLIENKIGLKRECRAYAHQQYRTHFEKSEKSVVPVLDQAELEPSLFYLIQQWLEYVSTAFVNKSKFWSKYKEAVNQYLEQNLSVKATSRITHDYHVSNYDKKKIMFNKFFDSIKYSTLFDANEQKFSLNATQGAIIISLYRNNNRFSQYYQILILLVELDMGLSKWRYNHMLMVQRMIGSQNPGTGGSSGYYYLRSTLSDHYKIFIDLINLPAFLIPEKYVPPLSSVLKENNADILGNGN